MASSLLQGVARLVGEGYDRPDADSTEALDINYARVNEWMVRDVITQKREGGESDGERGGGARGSEGEGGGARSEGGGVRVGGSRRPNLACGPRACACAHRVPIASHSASRA